MKKTVEEKVLTSKEHYDNLMAIWPGGEPRSVRLRKLSKADWKKKKHNRKLNRIKRESRRGNRNV